VSKKQKSNKKALAYVVDMQLGNNSYVYVEGVGERRANFMRMVEGLEHGEGDVLVVAKAELLFVDTSPMWLE
jgi:hypothetical protein